MSRALRRPELGWRPGRHPVHWCPGLRRAATTTRGARIVDEPAAEDNLKAFFTERAQQPGHVPLTAEDFARIAGELEIAYRLAWLKRQTSSSPHKGDRPPPR
jgi:hypothetical protein